ncbi:MAG: uridine phosphorylase [Oscillospiraceae bacterium]|nr:uridine phosphorylase [Oscillospiraceae bacterium]
MQSAMPFHLQCDPQQIGRYVLLPGDPGRVPKIAAYLEQAVQVSQNREFTIYSGFLEGERISVASTGIGGPSAAIAMEELVQCGADTFLRIGTCGGMQPELLPGTLILPSGAVRMDGTSQEYMPLAFPAVADFSLLQHVVAAAEQLQYSYQVGIVQCKDSFYGQHNPERMPVKQELLANWAAWKAAGVLASEMESATLFVTASVLHVRCATILHMIWNQEREQVSAETAQLDPDTSIRTAIAALRRQIAADQTASR